MDEIGVRAALQHYLDHSAAREEDVAHEIYADDAVLEFPQSGERFEGVRTSGNGAAGTRPRRSTSTSAACAAAATSGSSNSGSATTAARGTTASRSWSSARSLVARETIYVMDGWEAPEWRSEWWAAPPNPVAGGF